MNEDFVIETDRLILRQYKLIECKQLENSYIQLKYKVRK